MRWTGSGFTLIELLISTVLLAAISSGMAMVISTCLNAWRSGQSQAELAQEAEAIVEVLTQDLRASYFGGQGFFVTGVDEEQQYADFTTLSRRDDRLFYLASQAAPLRENRSDLAQVVYFTAPAGDGSAYALYRQEICPPTGQPLELRDPAQEGTQLLSDRVASLGFRFWQPGQQWVEEWQALAADSTTQEHALPPAVEVSLTLADGSRRYRCLTRVSLVMANGPAASQ